ncbi:uncharacterized protein LOC102681041 [Apis dorsata]|uniref:uncharacterized protein LOC102681041 n=1 Tax=Apis dorsata TaxID=7462 RepID=UPI0003DF6F3D|nr:uncharacterized protein LOC102681041 [Apis dorsata]
MSINTESMGDLKDRLTMEKMDSVPGCVSNSHHVPLFYGRSLAELPAYARVKARIISERRGETKKKRERRLAKHSRIPSRTENNRALENNRLSPFVSSSLFFNYIDRT